MYWGAKRKPLREVSDSSDEAEQKKTCGSTVFSTGHPRQYSLAPAMLVCADRTRRGRFIAVWPQMKCTHSASYTYPSTLPHLRQKTLSTAQAGHVMYVAQVVFAEGLYSLAMYMYACCSCHLWQRAE